MLNNVTFTSKQSMLTNAIEKTADGVSVIKASSILPQKIQKDVSKIVYTSPFAPITTPVKENAGKILNYFG